MGSLPKKEERRLIYSLRSSFFSEDYKKLSGEQIYVNQIKQRENNLSNV